MANASKLNSNPEVQQIRANHKNAILKRLREGSVSGLDFRAMGIYDYAQRISELNKYTKIVESEIKFVIDPIRGYGGHFAVYRLIG